MTFAPTCRVLHCNSTSVKGSSLSGFVRRHLPKRRRKKTLGHLIFSLHALIRPMLMEAISGYWSFLSNPCPAVVKPEQWSRPATAFPGSAMIDGWIRWYASQYNICKGRPFIVFSMPRCEFWCGYLAGQCTQRGLWVVKEAMRLVSLKYGRKSQWGNKKKKTGHIITKFRPPSGLEAAELQNYISNVYLCF